MADPARISPDEINGIYAELAMMQVDLDKDPLIYGPKRLNEKVALCRQHLSRCERVFTGLIQRQHMLRKEKMRTEAERDLRKDDMLANDPEVRSGRNVADRNALAAVKLRDLIIKINGLDAALDDVDTLISLVKVKRSDLRDTQGRLRDQWKICLEEIGLGGKWGTRRDDAPDLEPGKYKPTPDILSEIIGEREVHLSEAEDPDEPELVAEPIPADQPAPAAAVEAENKGDPLPPADPEGAAIMADILDALPPEEVEVTPPPEKKDPPPPPPVQKPEEKPLVEQVSKEDTPAAEDILPGEMTEADMDIMVSALEGEFEEAAPVPSKPKEVDMDALIDSLMDDWE